MESINLLDISTRAPKQVNKIETKEKTEKTLGKLNDLQNLLYAESKHAVLIVLQGMDASGKDGTIRNVFGHLNPQGVHVKSFKVPTAEELAHDFLWRIHLNTPAKGIIQIFNRSHYEDIIVTRVHNIIDDDTAFARMKAINDFEELLVKHNNTTLLKIYLHISPEKQQEKIKERITDPQKNWKYNENDLAEAKLWPQYMSAYEDCFANCNAIPWNIVPADQNWYKEYTIATKLLNILESLNMQYPMIKSKSLL